MALRELPVDPIELNVRQTIDKNVGYVYETAMLMMAICVLRRWKQMDQRDEGFLRFLLSEIGWDISAGNFTALSVFLRTFLEALVVREWNDNRLMCSQFVSLMFNNCDNDQYHIVFTDRPMGEAHKVSKRAVQPASADVLQQLTNFEDTLKNRVHELLEIDHSVLEDVLKSAFTPGDIRTSKRVKYLGQLEDSLG